MFQIVKPRPEISYDFLYSDEKVKNWCEGKKYITMEDLENKLSEKIVNLTLDKTPSLNTPQPTTSAVTQSVSSKLSDETKTFIKKFINESTKQFVLKTGDKISGNIDMNNQQIFNVPIPKNEMDVANKFYVDSKISPTAVVYSNGSLVKINNVDTNIFFHPGLPIAKGTKISMIIFSSNISSKDSLVQRLNLVIQENGTGSPTVFKDIITKTQKEYIKSERLKNIEIKQDSVISIISTQDSAPIDQGIITLYF